MFGKDLVPTRGVADFPETECDELRRSRGNTGPRRVYRKRSKWNYKKKVVVRVECTKFGITVNNETVEIGERVY